MANSDKLEPVSSESSKDGPDAVTPPLQNGTRSGPTPAIDGLNGLVTPILPLWITPLPLPLLHHPQRSLFIPHPKRFNAVNINRKFLQKNSTSSAVDSFTAATKAGSLACILLSLPHFLPLTFPAAWLSLIPPTSHSKLVTSHP
ncbi:hypothetical protein JVT61DRAFT_9264 [Boletus reticuloceps]|uniref:Uncharacterized protein n=1 Tax=Boletus reticuloceps TaxID=495285 RepID=A0A8I3A4T4_9AGAM|nr:hypothetical protein JVT61DRAFT_9264 [Boletus reticuloceps]